MQIDGDAVLLGFRDPVSAIAWCLATQQVQLGIPVAAKCLERIMDLKQAWTAKTCTPCTKKDASIVIITIVFTIMMGSLTCCTLRSTKELPLMLPTACAGIAWGKLAQPASEAQAHKDIDIGWSDQEHCNITACPRAGECPCKSLLLLLCFNLDVAFAMHVATRYSSDSVPCIFHRCTVCTMHFPSVS